MSSPMRADAPDEVIRLRTRYIVQEVLGTGPEDFGDETNLEDLASDSLKFLEILCELETAFGIQISDEDVEDHALQMVENIVVYLVRRL